jgi:hypothetical protein
VSPLRLENKSVQCDATDNNRYNDRGSAEANDSTCTTVKQLGSVGIRTEFYDLSRFERKTIPVAGKKQFATKLYCAGLNLLRQFSKNMSIVPLSTSQEVLLDIANSDAVEESRYKRYGMGICNSHSSLQAVIEVDVAKL